MQCSSMKISCAFDTSSVQLSNARKTKEIPVAGIICVSAACLVSTVGLLLWAFNAVPDSEISAGIPCVASVDAVGSETLQTFLIFALGYFGCLAVRRRTYLAQQVYNVLCIVNKACASTSAAVATLRPRSPTFQQPSWFNKGVAAIAVASMLCTVCIVALLVSAFTAEPDQDPTESGLASESSTFMRIFTVGWMFILSFKLRRELVGLVGSGCLLQPW